MSRMIKTITGLLLLSYCLSIQAQENNTQPPLIFGLLPSESTVTKFKRYAPLRDYLAVKLQRKVILETARDFAEFAQRTQQRRYDFLETAPHFVPPAIDSGKYQVITTITQPLSAQVVVLKTSSIDSLNQLSGKSIATPSPKAIITKIGQQTVNQRLKVAGLKLAEYTAYKTHNAAYEAVIGNKADAAIISVNIYNKALSKNEPLKSIGQSEPIPNMSVLVATDLPQQLRKALLQQLVEMQNTPDGNQTLKKIAYPGYRKTTAQEFDKLRRYLNQ